MRGPDTNHVLKIQSEQRYKQCLISVMIIELPRNAINETQHTCQFEDDHLSLNRLITEIQANIEKKII
jgi:hypothetical protein